MTALDDTPVVLVHGWAGSFATTWHGPGIDALLADAGRPVIGVDLLGHGEAPKPHDPAEYADLTTRIVERLPADRAVDAIGRDAGRNELIAVAAEGGSDPDDMTFARFAAYANEDGNDPVALAACMRRPALDPITPEMLAGITCPVLVALGDRDQAGAGEKLAATFPDGRFVRLRNTDHFATPESFPFIDAALKFLEV